MATERRMYAKRRALKLALDHVNGDENLFVQGKGLYRAVRAIYPRWFEEFKDIVDEYNTEHTNEFTVKILQERVDKFFYKYRKDLNVKGRCVGGEHPDNSPSYQRMESNQLYARRKSAVRRLDGNLATITEQLDLITQEVMNDVRM